MVDYYAPTRRPITDLTEDMWYVDGVSLNTLAFNVVTLDGGREGPPPVRGENLLVPLRPGRIWAERFPEERVITLGIWVNGADPRTGLVPDEMRRQFLGNYQHLTEMFYTPWRQIELRKEWIDPATGATKSATAKANYSGGLELMRKQGPYRGVFVVDLVLAEPYFYDDVPFDGSYTGTTAANNTFTLLSNSVDIHRKLTVNLSASQGGLGNLGTGKIGDAHPQFAGEEYADMHVALVNETSRETDPNAPVVWVGFRQAMAQNQNVKLDTLEFTSRQVSGPLSGDGSTNWAAWTQHGGTRHWMLLLPGLNHFRLLHGGSSGGNGLLTARIRFNELHF